MAAFMPWRKRGVSIIDLAIERGGNAIKLVFVAKSYTVAKADVPGI
jgi:hypothetical protein